MSLSLIHALCKQSHLRKDLSKPHGRWTTLHCCACGYVPTEGAP